MSNLPVPSVREVVRFYVVRIQEEANRLDPDDMPNFLTLLTEALDKLEQLNNVGHRPRLR